MKKDSVTTYMKEQEKYQLDMSEKEQQFDRKKMTKVDVLNKKALEL